jgi:hypothetical protein
MFREDAVMARLRDAKPAAIAETHDDQLRNRIVSQVPTWRTSSQAAALAKRRAWAPGVWRSRRVRSGLAASGLVAAALVVAVVVSVSGSVPNVAQAFPVLNNAPVLTPAALQQSLKYYGVAGDGGLDIRTGRTVATPWGTGYILTGPDDQFVCVVTPGPSAASWGASCAQAKQATSQGTMRDEYAYDAATHTARLVALLPKGATATTQTSGGTEHHLSLPDGLLAMNIASRTRLKVTINGHASVEQFVPRHTMSGLTSVATS